MAQHLPELHCAPVRHPRRLLLRLKGPWAVRLLAPVRDPSVPARPGVTRQVHVPEAGCAAHLGSRREFAAPVLRQTCARPGVVLLQLLLPLVPRSLVVGASAPRSPGGAASAAASAAAACCTAASAASAASAAAASAAAASAAAAAAAASGRRAHVRWLSAPDAPAAPLNFCRCRLGPCRLLARRFSCQEPKNHRIACSRNLGDAAHHCVTRHVFAVHASKTVAHVQARPQIQSDAGDLRGQLRACSVKRWSAIPYA